MAKAKSGQLAANTVRTVTIDAHCATVTVVNRDQVGEIWFTTSGVDPTIAGDDCYLAAGARTVATPNISSATVVKMISAGTQFYVVEGETS